MRCPRLTGTKRLEREESLDERYIELTMQVEQEERDEYERDFGSFYKEKHPYQVNFQSVHEKVERIMKAEQEQYNEDGVNYD